LKCFSRPDFTHIAPAFSQLLLLHRTLNETISKAAIFLVPTFPLYITIHQFSTLSLVALVSLPPRNFERLSFVYDCSYLGHMWRPSYLGHLWRPSYLGHVAYWLLGHMWPPSYLGHMWRPCYLGHMWHPSYVGHLAYWLLRTHVASSLLRTHVAS
jgi:hypothetical protein